MRQKRSTGSNYLLKCLLGRIGPAISARTIHRLDATISYLETGRRLKSFGLRPSIRLHQKKELFDLIIRQVEHGRTLYLEFGVFEGESMRYWSEHLKNPQAQLHGFDSFTGLPEDWNIDSPKGLFSTQGKVPELPDPRVRFFKGWFEDTLPHYHPPEHETLILNMDADLYSSTSYVLNVFQPLISVGTYLYFDEFADRFNELRAFTELRERGHLQFELLGTNQTLSKVVFKRTG